MSRRVQRPTGPPQTRPVPTPPRIIPTQAKLLPRAVVLVGPMAVGKTSVGKRVAKQLGIPFIDTDARFAQAHGAIADFFVKRGESEFRRIEAEIIAEEIAQPGPRVISVGGGAVLTESTRMLLQRYPVILLMSTQRAVLRTANLSRRPLLKGDPGAWQRILDERRPFYEEVANVTFRTDRSSKEQVTRRVTSWIERLPSVWETAEARPGRAQTAAPTQLASDPQARDNQTPVQTEAAPGHGRTHRGRRGGRRRRRGGGAPRPE